MPTADPVILAYVRSPSIAAALESIRDSGNYAIRIAAPSFEHWREAIIQVADASPALIIVELGGEAAELAGRSWLGMVRSEPATRRIPAVAIGENEAAARVAAGLTMPMIAPAEFIADPVAVIQAHAKIYTQTVRLGAECAEPLPALVLKGLHEFNAGEYFECHETLEAAWKSETGPVRDVYRAILQIGLAYYQITRENYSGALKMFLRAVQWFAPLPSRCQGIDIAALRADAETARAHLEALGPTRIAEFDRSLFKPVRYKA